MNLPREKGVEGCIEEAVGALAFPLAHSGKFQAPTRKQEEGQSREANHTVPCLCSVSFHRNHTATVRSQAENTTVSHVENEYSQPPRNSQVSAYAGKRPSISPCFWGGGRLQHGSRDHWEQGCPGGEGAHTAL